MQAVCTVFGHTLAESPHTVFAILLMALYELDLLHWQQTFFSIWGIQMQYGVGGLGGPIFSLLAYLLRG